MNLVEKGNSRLSYFMMFVLIGQAGLPFFVGNTWLLIFFTLSFFLFILGSKPWDSFIFKYLLFFVGLMAVQILVTGEFLVGTFVGILIRILFAYIAIKLIGANFMNYFVEIIFYLTVLGLMLWVILSFFPGIYELSRTFSLQYIRPLELFPEHVRDNLIIYTNEYWLKDLPPRNAGAFWEPGGNGVFIIVAILFNTILCQKLINRKNIIFFIALLTTFSLGSYVAFSIFIYSFLIFVKKISFSTSVILMLLFGAFYYAYNSYDFLGGKFERRYSKMQTLENDLTYDNLDYRVGRNEQAILDIRAFLKSPIVGEGQFKNYKYGSSASGITSFLKKWGMLGFLFVFGSMYNSFKRYICLTSLNRGYYKVAVITLIFLAISQSLYGKPFFLGLTFLFLVFNRNEINKGKNYVA